MKAKAELTAQASSQGTIVEGTVSVEVKLFEFDHQTDAVDCEPVGSKTSSAAKVSTAERITLEVYKFRAACYGKHFDGPWYGPIRNTAEVAAGEAENHKGWWGPGHGASVQIVK